MALAFGTEITLPPEVHPTFTKTMESAQAAYAKGETQKALAMLEGVVYPDGVTVKLDLSTTGSASTKATSAVKRAVSTWARELEGDSPIRLVGNNEKADVKIVLTDSIPQSSEDALGLIDLKKEYRWNNVRHEVSNSGTIYIMRIWDGKPLTEDEMTEVATHELGHLLGLADAEFVGHLMGPMMHGQSVLAPKPHEVRAVQILRSNARTLLQQYAVPLQPATNHNFLNDEPRQNSYSHLSCSALPVEQKDQARRCNDG